MGKGGRDARRSGPELPISTPPSAGGAGTGPGLLAAAAAGLAVHLWLGWGLIRASAPTYDEPVHLASGYNDLITGAYRLNAVNHPPFGEMWAAVPLAFMNPTAFFQHPYLAQRRVYNFADHFLYKNRLAPEAMLNAARAWTLVTWSLAFGIGVIAWAVRMDAAPGGLAAAFLFAFCVPLFSNSALVTTDSPSAACFFLAFFFLSRPQRSHRDWILAGVATGLSMATKFNMVVILPLAGVMLATERRLAARGFPAPPMRASGPLLGLAAMVFALAAVYRFAALPRYFEGLKAINELLAQGRSSFLMGRHSTLGTLLYFPAALAIKTPLVLLGLGFLGLARWLKSPDVQRFWAAAPAVAYFLAVCFSKTQIGYRHLLPAYPFLVVMAASGAAFLWGRGGGGRGLCAVLGAWLAVSVARVHPHHLAYFNEAAGGPSRGYRYLVDSNLDWGQGLQELAAQLREIGNPPIFLSYFGVADPSYYGIRHQPFAWITNVDRREGIVPESVRFQRVLVAISATNLQAAYFVEKDLFGWLKARPPLAVAAHSIFLYDLTGDEPAVRHLASLLEAEGQSGAARRLLVQYANGGKRPH